MRSRLWRLIKMSVLSWRQDYATSMGAALAYYTLFSLAPLLLVAASVAGAVFGEEAARGEIVRQLAGLVGLESARAVEAVLVALDRPEAGRLASAVGVLVLLVGATSVFAELQGALDRIWQVQPPPGAGLWDLLRTRLLSLGLVLGVGFLLLVSLLASAAFAALGTWWGPWFDGLAPLLEAVNAVFSVALTTLLFAMIYRWMPRVVLGWRDVALGALVTALLFTLGKTLIGQYIGRAGIASPFGAAGSLVVLLVWVYWSAQVFLFGAELTRVVTSDAAGGPLRRRRRR
jgi:membrane protein